jgi:Spy/CpxP family protein refolding chaperone
MSQPAHSLLRTAAAFALVASLATSASAQDAPADPVVPDPQVAPTADPVAPASNARARRPSFPPGLAEARLIRERAEVIGAGEETLEKLEKLVAEIRAKEEELRNRTVETENQVRTLLDENLPDEKALLAAGGVGSEVARETRRLRLQTSLRVRALLTKEQLVKFMELREKAFSKRRRTGGRPRH